MTDKPMGTKEKLLLLLEQHRGAYVSGEEIGAQLAISRAAIWKAVNALRLQGYPIEAAPKRGYCLAGQTDILSAQGIGQYLQGDYRVLFQQTVPSTNAVLKGMAESGEPEGTVLVSGSQSAGRGRLGRTFYSPSDTGVYLSILLRPRDATPQQIVGLTTRAAVAACQAVESVSGREAGIKWVNDILLDGKKVCGILTEGAFSMETGTPEYVIVGVGFNAYSPENGFPAELSDIAGAVFPSRTADGKNKLAAAFLNAFQAVYREPDISERYRAKCCILGKPVTLITPTGTREAVALDIDSRCRLVVEHPDGTREALASGEVRVRIS